MIPLQRFKESDLTETKVISVLMNTLLELGDDRDSFFEEAYEAYPLGDILYDLDRDPMSGVISRDLYRSSFPAIHQLFTRPGTFEFYLEVFRSIWGPDVNIQFAVPSPGVLTINVEALDTFNFDFVARQIVDNAYEYNPITDQWGDNLQFVDTTGIKNQNEINALLNELSPHGIFVVTTLTI